MPVPGDLQGTIVPANTSIKDRAIVTGSAGFVTPTGTVTFQFSPSRTPLPGSYSYNASYSGDANYPAAGPSGCEPITVSRFNSAINTAILRVSDGADVTNQVIDLMNAASVAVQDQATVTGSGPTPTGTVTIMRFDNGNCSGTAPAPRA